MKSYQIVHSPTPDRSVYAASAFVAISSFILAIAAAGLSPLGQVLEHWLSACARSDVCKGTNVEDGVTSV